MNYKTHLSGLIATSLTVGTLQATDPTPPSPLPLHVKNTALLLTPEVEKNVRRGVNASPATTEILVFTRTAKELERRDAAKREVASKEAQAAAYEKNSELRNRVAALKAKEQSETEKNQQLAIVVKEILAQLGLTVEKETSLADNLRTVKKTLGVKERAAAEKEVNIREAKLKEEQAQQSLQDLEDTNKQHRQRITELDQQLEKAKDEAKAELMAEKDKRLKQLQDVLESYRKVDEECRGLRDEVARLNGELKGERETIQDIKEQIKEKLGDDLPDSDSDDEFDLEK